MNAHFSTAPLNPASIRRKQNVAGMNSAYLDKVLLAGINGMVKE